MKNNIFIISGPSGAGEDSVIEGLKKIIPIERVTTTSTRDMRSGESQKNPYYFISREEFEKGILNNEFFEYAEEYNEKFYGVTKKEIERVKNSGKISLWKIESKGVITAKKLMPDIIAILINSPLNILEERIRGRGGISEDKIKERMNYTIEWMKYKDIYDYEVINEQEKLEVTINKVADIIRKEMKR